LALVITVVTRDLAFGWATTLDISAKEFYNFLSFFAFWKFFCKECVPSLELVELSRFARLGGGVTKEQIQSATKLGQWWKFLAMSLLFYGVVFRTVIYLISLKLKPKKIEFVSNKSEPEFKQIDNTYDNKSNISSLEGRDFHLIGYYVDPNSLNIKSNPKANEIVIAVKSYEPPILDFFDYLDEILEENKDKKISLLMIGVGQKADKKDVDVWIRKLKELDYDFIEVIS